MVEGIVSTIAQKCKRCYSCIRECPASAIRVVGGQAVILQERCISCGNCVKVCSQKAKIISNEIEFVMKELIPSYETIAIVAPSFAVSFPDEYMKFPTAIKAIGFDRVVETAFGADLISPIYLEEFENRTGKTIITSSCPAVNNFIQKYYTDLIPNLAKIVSPMIAAGKYLKENYPQAKVVFIGPCSAKKQEYIDEEVAGVIDAVLTFTDIKEILEDERIEIDQLKESFFDPPYAFLGKSFPLPGGLLKTAGISDDVLDAETIIVEGKDKIKAILNELSAGRINSKFIDVLFCEGCISGPAIDSELNYYAKREKIIEFIDKNIARVDRALWKSNIYNSRQLDFKRTFKDKNQRRPTPDENKIKEILALSNKFTTSDELNCGACGYSTCRDYAVAIAKGLAENEMCLPYLIDSLESAYNELKETQEQLHNAEKLVSIGQLAAGVAHEINNPLGSIMIYSSIVKKELSEIKEKQNSIQDIEIIMSEAKRCKNIVSNLLNFARQGKLKISKTFPAEITQKVIKNCSINPKFNNVKIIIDDNSKINSIDADSEQIQQVLTNIIINACEACENCKDGTVKIEIKNDENNYYFSVSDNGGGITEENQKKLFTPFFTTKKMGDGTGLGLAISYGIIKMHRGDINFKSTEKEGTEFIVRLPIKNKQSFININ